jgi:hypothetical protein
MSAKKQSRALWMCLLLARIAMAIGVTATMSAAAAASPVEVLTATETAQLSPLMMSMSDNDWRMFVGSEEKPQLHCLDLVARAREFMNITAGNNLNIVPISNSDGLPTFDGFGISSYCYMPVGNTTLTRDKLEWQAW